MPRRPRRPAPSTRLAVLVVVGLIALLPGCSIVGTSPAHEVRQAFLTSAAAGPARVAFSTRAALAGQDVDVTGDGVVDMTRQAADVTLQLPTVGAVHTLVVGGTAYAQVPSLFAAFLPGTGRWAAVDLDRLSRLQFGVPLAQLGGTNDPFEAMRYLEAVTDDARVVGREPVEGHDTTRYAAAIDLARTPAASDPATRSGIDRLRATTGSTLLPVEVWVDEQGYLRRVSQTVTTGPGGTPGGAGAGAQGAAGSATTTVTLREYGVPADIKAPPPNEVTDLGALLPTG